MFTAWQLPPYFELLLLAVKAEARAEPGKRKTDGASRTRFVAIFHFEMQAALDNQLMLHRSRTTSSFIILIARTRKTQWRRYSRSERQWIMLRSRVSAVTPLQHLRLVVLMRLTAAFEDFLLNYKFTQTDLDTAATDAFQDLNIDGDGTSDEYDFMDDVAGGKEARRPLGQPSEARRKYMDMLQKVADRQLNQVTIELDDLDNVSLL